MMLKEIKIKDYIKYYLKEKQLQIALDIGMNFTKFNLFLNGHDHAVSMHDFEIDRIAKRINVQKEELLTGIIRIECED